MAGFINHNRSILVRLLRYFVILFLIQFSLFATLSGIYQRKMLVEIEEQSTETLRQLCFSFSNEFVRLDALLTSCMDDPSILLSAFGKVPDARFRNYATDASQKLHLMRNSLPYAENLFVYVANRDMVIRHTSGYIERESFATYVLNLSEDEQEEFWTLDTGFYNIEGKSFYIKRIYNFGFIAVQINMDIFGNIQNSLDDQYKFIILDQNDQLIMKSQSLDLEDSALKKSLDTNSVENNGVQYSLLHRNFTSYSLTGILFRDMTEYLSIKRYNFIVVFSSGILLFISFLSLLFLNIRIYVPLRRLARRFGVDRENEIELIEERLNELLYELYLKSRKNPQSTASLDIALQYLLYGGKQLQGEDIESLSKKYTSYQVMTLILQNDSGDGGLHLLSEMEPTLLEEYELDIIHLDAYKAVMILRNGDSTEILQRLSRMLLFHPKYRLFAGLKADCHDIGQIHEDYLVTESRLKSCRINPEPLNYSICSTDSEWTPCAMIGTSKLSELIYDNDPNEFRRYLEKQFYKTEALTLRDIWEIYTEVLTVFKSFPSLSKLSLAVNVSREQIYHPEYMLNLLCRYYTSLNKMLTEDSAGSLCANIIQYVNDHFTSVLSLDIIAEAFNLNPVYLSNMFKKNTGVNLSAYISKLRMDKAILMIQTKPSLKIYEIAEDVGIDNPSTFIRQFKKYTGMTPEQYRRNYLINQHQGKK